MDAMKNTDIPFFPRQSPPVARGHGAATVALDARPGVEALIAGVTGGPIAPSGRSHSPPCVTVCHKRGCQRFCHQS